MANARYGSKSTRRLNGAIVIEDLEGLNTKIEVQCGERALRHSMRFIDLIVQS